MKRWTMTLGLLREAAVSALSQPVATVLTVIMVAGMAAAALLTTGQSAAAEHAALSRIDAAGTRAIVVRAQDGAGLTASVVDRISSLAEVEAVTAFGPVLDVRNSAVAGAPPTGIRPVYGDLTASTTLGTVRASAQAATALGLADGTGSVVARDGRSLDVVGPLAVPDHLTFLEPLAVVAGDPDPDAPVTTVVVLVRAPHLVEPVAVAVGGLISPDDPTKVSVETSAELAAVRAAVSGELATYGRATVLLILGVASLLVAANLFGMVQLRRKDFGRRRALGASQVLIVALLLVQTGLAAVVGAVTGSVVALGVLRVNGSPLPGPEFTLAVGVAAVLTSLCAALLPAAAAARREPLHELRIA